MKGSVYSNPKFISLQTKIQKVHKINPLIASDNKHLYFKGLGKDDTLKSTKWQDKVIINCTYLKSYKIILVLCENYRLYVLTENLEEIISMTGWQSKYNVAFQYIEEFGMLLMIGAQTVEMIKVLIDSNIKKTKFLSSIKFSLKKLAAQPKIAKVTLPWNKGYNINFHENFLYVWSPQAIAFLKINNLEVLSESFNLTKKQHPITFAHFSNYYKYTLIGTLLGEIKVWRLPLSQKFQHQNVLIHTFQGHSKSITSICESKNNQKTILTSAEDLQVCFWNLETFELLRKFDLFGIYSEIHIKNNEQAFVVKDGFLGQLNFGQSLQFITQTNSPIMMVNKQTINDKTGSLTFTFQENLGVVMQTDYLLKGKNINKMQIKYIYPPLKVKSIKQIISSPFVQHQYYLLAQNGQLFKVIVPPFTKEFQGVSSKIQQIYNIELVTDKQKHPLHQRPTYIEFLNILPPQYDSEIRQSEDGEKKSFRAEKSSQIELNSTKAVQKYQDLRLLMIGCTRGSVVFLSTKNMSKVYCRLTYHRQKVLYVQGIKQYKSVEFNPLNGYLASYCSQNYLKIIKFDHTKSTAHCNLTYFAGQQLKMLRSFENFLIIVFYKGQFEITELDMIGNTEQICCKRSNVLENHQGELLSLDYERNYQLLMSSGSDNRIKIWTMNKILLYDIILDEGLMYSLFISRQAQQKVINTQKLQILQKKQQSQTKINLQQNSVEQKLKELMSRPRPVLVRFDLIIAHSKKLLLFNTIPLSFRPQQIEQINQNSEYLDNQKVLIREVFETYSQKNVLQGSRDIINKVQNYEENEEFLENSRKKNILKTEPSKYSPKIFFSEKHFSRNEEQSPVKQFKKSRIHTQNNLEDVQDYNKKYPFHLSSTKKQLDPLLIRKKKKLQNNNGIVSISMKKSFLQKHSMVTTSTIEQTKKHLKDLFDLKQQINFNKPILPAIKTKKEDIFDKFMREKLMKKNVLTRRDITLNRIIMKNIIRDHFETESKQARDKIEF